jgi:hypothetical protein
MILLLTAFVCAADSVSIDNFTHISDWVNNPDGGLIEITSDTSKDKTAMRLRFMRKSHQWGNAVRSISLPENACGIEFDLFVEHAEPTAVMSMWLLEKDGDGHLAYKIPDNKLLVEMKGGWRHCFVPITSFRYDPRGNKVYELLSTDRMLIGINQDSADIRIANLAFRTIKRSGYTAVKRTPNLTIENGPKGRIAILEDDFPKEPGNANPRTLAATLRRHGYGVTMLKSGDVADQSVLRSDRFDCLVMPHGPYYPEAAYEAIKKYLKTGGSFLAVGGYTFDRPCKPDEGGRMVPVETAITAGDLAAGKTGPARLNTRFGKLGDTMGLEADQIGVFDPAYHLKYATEMKAAQMQFVVPASFRQHAKLEGYSACSMLGSNNPVFPEKWGRHISLVDAYDLFGRLRGSIGAMVLNYAGPYAGSAWAFFGITNMDLFAENGPMLPHVGSIVDALVRKVFLHSLGTDLACYKDGETVKLSCRAANFGRTPCKAEVRFRVLDRSERQIFASDPIKLSLNPQDGQIVETQFKPTSFESDLYRVVAELRIGGKIVDLVESGFAAYCPIVRISSLKLTYKDNYFYIDERPVLLSGTNVTGAIFYSGNENPLVWDRDLARMNENGLNILRVLHFSPFLSDKPAFGAVKPADLAVDRLPLKIERQLDAFVQLCRKHNIVPFLSIHDWMPVELSDEELAAQRRFAKLIAARYKDVPGFMIDIQNEPHLDLPRDPNKMYPADVVKAWNDYLKTKYGTDENLKVAWSRSSPQERIGSIPYLAGTDAWDDMRTFDADYFRNVLLNRWAKANYCGAKEGCSTVPVTIGFLQEYWSLNKLICTDWVDFANMHSYNSIDVMRADLKLFDRRFQGKSVSLGEFGALPDHEKRVHGQDNPNQDIGRFLLTGHYLFGLGGSFMANWCWKDMDDVVFPWGINYTCGGPRKDILKAYRNQSFLMRQIIPVYEPPSVFLVVPVCSILGGQSGQTIRMLYRHVDALLNAHINFGVIDDRHLDQLPPSAKLLIYPVPMAISDDVYDRLKSFVEAGGQLFITGDISYDSLRRRNRTQRLDELCGVRFVSEAKHGVDWGNGDEAIINVEPTNAECQDMLFVHKLRNGQVRYTPVPSGMLGNPRRYALGESVENSNVNIDTDGVHQMSIQEANGSADFLINVSSEARSVRFRPAETELLEITLQPNGTGFIRRNNAGGYSAIESNGPIKISTSIGSLFVAAQGCFALLSPDGSGIENARELLVVPFGNCEIDLRGLPALKGAVVQTGDVIEGKWITLSESSDLKIKTTEETAFDIRIVAPKSRLVELGNKVASELMLR